MMPRHTTRSESSDKYLLYRFITTLARRNLPSVTALLAKLLMKQIAIEPTGDTTKRDASVQPRRVLVLPRRGFNDDVLLALREIPAVMVLSLKRRVFKSIANAFLPSEVDDNNYLTTSPTVKEAMLAYRKFLAQFWQALDPHRRIDAVISGNFGYYAERELAAALEELGVPFIVLHKENSWSAGSQSFWERVYRERRGPFMGRRILVYSPIERDMQLRAGVVDRDRIEVIGMPRLDAVHHWRESHVGLAPQTAVLFASFLPEVGMPALAKGVPVKAADSAPNLGTRTLNLSTVCHSTHRAILRLAIENPEVKVMIKTKGRQRDRVALTELLGVTDETHLPPNLHVHHGGSPLPLIGEASVVCGLHSTLLLEALAAGRPVIVPCYAEVLDPEIRHYLFNLGDAVTTASSPDELVELLLIASAERKPVPAALPLRTVTFLTEWLGNADGKAGERAGAAIIRSMQR
jgi:hypothetical protein